MSGHLVRVKGHCSAGIASLAHDFHRDGCAGSIFRRKRVVRAEVASKRLPALLACMMLAGSSHPASAAAPISSNTVIHQRNGQAILLSHYRGRWMRINYRATWCSDCIEEFPSLNRIASDARVAVIGLSDERIQPAAWTAFLAAHPLAYPVALVDRAALPARLPPSAFLIEMRPIGYLIRPDGRIARRFIGSVDPSELETVMARDER